MNASCSALLSIKNMTEEDINRLFVNRKKIYEKAHFKINWMENYR